MGPLYSTSSIPSRPHRPSHALFMSRPSLTQALLPGHGHAGQETLPLNYGYPSFLWKLRSPSSNKLPGPLVIEKKLRGFLNIFHFPVSHISTVALRLVAYIMTAIIKNFALGWLPQKWNKDLKQGFECKWFIWVISGNMGREVGK